MKIRHICLLLAALFCGSQLLKADILVLKNGERKEGNILEERPDAVRMKYKITPKIWDEKDFPRADIQQIIKQKPEEIEIMELRKVMPAPDLFTADQYEQIIQDRLRPFVNKYPGTPQAKDVEAMISELQSEKDKVVAGQIKKDGQWISAELVSRDEYDTNAYKFRRSMNEKAAAADYVGALREFDWLRDPAKGFPASMNYAAAIPEVIAIMELYEKKLARMIIEQPMVQRLRDNGLKGKVVPELTYLQRAIDKEIAEWKAVYEAEKKAKIRWQTVYKYDLKSLQEAHKLVLAEKNKLMLLDQPGLVARNELLTQALRYIADGNAGEADATLKAATLSIKTGQALAMQDTALIITRLRLRLNALKTQQSKEKKFNSTIGAGSSAVAGSSAAITDDRVAQAMAQADKSRNEKKAAVEGEPKTPDDAKKPDDKKPDDAKAGKEEKDEAEAKPKSKSKAKAPRSTDTDSSAAIAPPAEEGGVQQYLLIGAGVLIVVLLAALLLQKKTAK